MASECDARVEQFRTRPLANAGPFTFVAAVLAEQHDEWAEGRRYLGLGALARA